MFFVSGLCVECHCSLECSAGRHGVSGLLLLSCWSLAKFSIAIVGSWLLGCCVSCPSPSPTLATIKFNIAFAHVLQCFRMPTKVPVCEQGGQGDEAIVEEACIAMPTCCFHKFYLVHQFNSGKPRLCPGSHVGEKLPTGWSHQRRGWVATTTPI